MSEHNVSEALRSPQVKVCGLTRVDEAVACAEAGADAIGCVFFPPSPRHVTGDQARSIVHALPGGVCSVGVFVNEDFQSVMEKVEHARLKAVQLHGQESPGLVKRLRREGITVIKALFADGDPPFASAATYDASAYLLECAGGKLPGGNARTWNWEAALEVSSAHPVLLAGGLDPQNVTAAMEAASPDAVDVSSAVESTPGRKDIDKVLRFLDAVRRFHPSREVRRIFP